MGKWFVYIVECVDGTYYTGVTTDIQRRLQQHNDGKGAKYTRMRRPVVLRALYDAKTKSDAFKEEYRIKQLRRPDKEKMFNIVLNENTGR
jgi:predicted GIY-YIG superfamily endonuclease